MAWYIRTRVGKPRKGSRQTVWQVVGPYRDRRTARTAADEQNRANPLVEWEPVDALFAETTQTKKRPRQKRGAA